MAEGLYHRIFLNCFGSRSLNKEARDTCWNIVTALLVCLFYELRAVRVVAEDEFNHPDRANKLYLWGVFQARQGILNLGCMGQRPRCGHMAYSMQETWVKGCKYLVFIIPHHGAFNNLSSMICLRCGLSLCCCSRS